MAKNDILIQIGLKGHEQFKKKLENSAHALRKTGQHMKRNGEELTRGITLPVVGIGTAAVMTAAKFEKLQVSMNALSKSAAEGEKSFRRLKELSAGTPFQLEDLVRAQNTLMGFSLSADDAFENVKILGDMAAITGADMNRLSVSFGQAAAEGRVMTKDIREFINNGIPMVSILAEEMNVAESEIFDLASEGKISFEVLQSAFKSATSEGGRFADGMKKQSKTIAGIFSTLKDNVSLLLADIGKAIVNAGLRELLLGMIAAAQKAVKAFGKLPDSFKKTVIVVSALAAAIGPLLYVMGQLTISYAAVKFATLQLLSSTVALKVAMGGLAALAGVAIYKLVQGFSELNNVTDKNAVKLNTLNNLRKTAIREVAGEINEVERLTAVAEDENESKENRIKAIKELQKISPAYNDALDGERINMDNLATATDKVTDALQKQAMVKAAQSQLEELSADLLALQSHTEVVGTSFGEKMAIMAKNIFTFGSVTDMATDSAKEGLNNQAQAVTAVQAKIEALKSFIEGNKGMFDGLFPEDSTTNISANIETKPDFTGEREVLGWRMSAMDILPSREGLLEGMKGIAKTIDEFEIKGPDLSGMQANIKKTIDVSKDGIQEFKESLSGALNTMQEWMPAIQGVFDLWGSGLDRKAEKQQAQYEAELERIQNSKMSEEAKERAIAKLNKKREKEEKKMAREKAKRDKAQGIFQAIIAGAVAVNQALPNVVLAAIVGGLAAIQVAAIASEPLPALAEGGLAYGPTQALVGDNPNAGIDPEVISPLSKLKKYMGGGDQRVRVDGGSVRVRGQDLIIALEAAQETRSRV